MRSESAVQHGRELGSEAAGMMAQLASWPQHTAEIMAGIGGTELPRALDRSLAQLVPFDMTVIFAYPDGAKPIYLHDGFYGHVPGQALGRYLTGAYLLDPFYTACARRVPPGLYRMRELAPDAFFSGVYVNSLAAGCMASYSLMRRNGRPPFSEAELSLLRHVEPVVRQAIHLHWKDLRPAGPPREMPRGAAMEHAFESFADTLLSVREQRIVQMILRGHSSHSIAARLGIAEGTVKNHRKSIYAKLEISSQQELFALFIRHLFG